MTNNDYIEMREDVVAPARGRAAPPPVVSGHTLVQINVGGRTVGYIDPAELKGRAQFALERASGILDMIDWLQAYAGTTEEDANFVESYLAERPHSELYDFAGQIGQALRDATDVPKRSGRRWTSR